MSTWTVFAVCFTTLLLITGSAFTLLAFYRAGKRLKEAELRGGAQKTRGGVRGLD